MNKYKRIITQLGYKIYEYPFAFYDVGMGKVSDYDAIAYKDALYTFKNDIKDADVGIYNFVDRVCIQIIKPSLMKQFLGVDKVTTLIKYQLVLKGLKRFFGNSTLFSEGFHWKNKRKIIGSAFNFQFVKGNTMRILQVCDQTLQKNQRQFKNSFPNQKGPMKFQLLYLCGQIYMNIMLNTFFSFKSNDQKINGQSYGKAIIKLISDLSTQQYQIPGFIFGKWIYKIGLTKNHRNINGRLKIIKAIGKDIIQKRILEIQKSIKNQSKCSDILEALIRQQSVNKGQGLIPHLNTDELLDQFHTFVLAGTDTTSHLTLMMTYYTLSNSNIQQKVRKQIDQYIHSDEDFNFDTLKKMKYINWIQNQTLRMYGPANILFFRQATQDQYIADIPIQKGTLLNYNVMANHYNQNYFKHPKEFRPQRWESQCDNLDSHAFVGFSAGPRTCIGKNHALIATKIVFIRIFQKYKKLKLLQKELQMVYNFVYEPKKIDIQFS